MGSINTSTIPTVEAGATPDEARRILSEFGSGWALVIEKGIVMGMVSVADLHREDPAARLSSSDPDAGPSLVWLDPPTTKSSRRAA